MKSIETVKKFAYSFREKFRSSRKVSYSQCGEDIVIKYLFDSLHISRPSYIDIGAFDPDYLNNTKIFYQHGARGINIEPNPHLFNKIKRGRKKDINLNLGIADKAGIMHFYIMSSPTMSTFSQEEAELLQDQTDMEIVEVIDVRVDTVPHVIQDYHDGIFPDLLSLDAEGMDYEILQTIDLDMNYPKVICVETYSYSETGDQKIDTRIINHMDDHEYMLYADNHNNTIFIKEKYWKQGR